MCLPVIGLAISAIGTVAGIAQSSAQMQMQADQAQQQMDLQYQQAQQQAHQQNRQIVADRPFRLSHPLALRSRSKESWRPS